MRNETLYADLYDFIAGARIVNTHCHHLQGEEFTDYSLDKLFNKSYVGWCGVSFDETTGSRAAFLEKVKNRSYFVWLQDALQRLYGLEEPITAHNWDWLSDRIRAAHRNPDHHSDILRRTCGYRRIILDGYWNPGTDNGLPDLFAPTYRINMFLYGYDRSVADHNGNNPQILYGQSPATLEEYVAFMREKVSEKVREGCVALKSALPYDRSNDFRATSAELARRVFTAGGRPGEEDVRHFQDYMFFELCKAAADLKVPFQCHTGLGELDRTNALRLRAAIVANPDTRFVLFHGGYPWTDDVAGLIHRYENVYADLCWLPIISPSAAARTLHELIEVGTADRITWGCDTWSSEESYGALLALRKLLARVFTEKIEDGYLDREGARLLIERILQRNAAELYGPL